jgi:hypothetical protein
MSPLQSGILAFRAGFKFGCKGYKESTPRDVLRRHPSYTSGQVTCYLNGEQDAKAGDFFRLDLCDTTTIPEEYLTPAERIPAS